MNILVILDDVSKYPIDWTMLLENPSSLQNKLQYDF